MQQRKKWQDFTPTQQRGMVGAGVVQLVLLVAALWDIWHRPEDEIGATGGCGP